MPSHATCEVNANRIALQATAMHESSRCSQPSAFLHALFRSGRGSINRMQHGSVVGRGKQRHDRPRRGRRACCLQPRVGLVTTSHSGLRQSLLAANHISDRPCSHLDSIQSQGSNSRQGAVRACWCISSTGPQPGSSLRRRQLAGTSCCLSHHLCRHSRQNMASPANLLPVSSLRQRPHAGLPAITSHGRRLPAAVMQACCSTSRTAGPAVPPPVSDVSVAAAAPHLPAGQRPAHGDLTCRMMMAAHHMTAVQRSSTATHPAADGVPGWITALTRTVVATGDKQPPCQWRQVQTAQT